MSTEMQFFSGPRSLEILKVGEQVQNVVIDHKSFKSIRDACRDLIHTMTALKSPAGILIMAEPGMGKSLLLDLIDREISKFDDKRGACLSLKLENAVDPSGIASAIALSLGYPAMPARPKIAALNHMVKSALDRTSPPAILIDEMQHVCEGHKEVTARAVTDWLKIRMDTYCIPVICAGTLVLERISTINPQFVSRASASYVIQPFQFDEQWRQLMAAFSASVNLVDLSIINTGVCRALHSVSGGNMRTLKRILTYACMHAAAQAERKVTLESLSRGYRDTKGDIAEHNDPFARL